VKLLINNASILLILLINLSADAFENPNHLARHYVDKDTVSDTLKKTTNSTTYMKGKNEFGIITGILNSHYSGCEYPIGFYYAFHYSENLFVEPLVSWQLAESNKGNYSYYHIGLAQGFMGDPKKFPCYFTIGFAFSNFKHIEKYNWSADTTSYKGFFVPMEFGIKSYLFNRRTLLTVALTDSFNKVTDYLEFGAGILSSFTFLLG
jgi:hypothetical protein